MRQHYYSQNSKNMKMEPSYPISLFVDPLSSAASSNKSANLGLRTDAAASRLAASRLGLYDVSESLLQVLHEQQTRQRQEQLLNPILLELAKQVTHGSSAIMSRSASSTLAPVAAPAPRVLAEPKTAMFSSPLQAGPEPGEVGTVPCRARGMPQDHKFKTAHFQIPKDVKHGQELFCSYAACRDGGVKFCYCMHCRIPVAKRNFRIRHHHCDMASPAPDPEETSTTHTTTRPPVSAAPTYIAPTAVSSAPSTSNASTQAQLATLILQSSLSQQLIHPPPNTSAQANSARQDFLRELCFFQTLAPGNLLPSSLATNNQMVALPCPPVATVINVTDACGPAPIPNMINGTQLSLMPTIRTEGTAPSTVMLPCRARGMPQDHQFAQAHFVVPQNIQHGDELVCSYSACRDAGVKFCFCTHCRIPVAKRNFRIRHNHCDFVPPPPSMVVGGSSYELFPQVRALNNNGMTMRNVCQEIVGDQKPAATSTNMSTRIEAWDSDPMSSKHHAVASKKRKRHRTTLPTPPNTLGSQSDCAQSSALMLQGGNDRLVNNHNNKNNRRETSDNRTSMAAWATSLGERPHKK